MPTAPNKNGGQPIRQPPPDVNRPPQNAVLAVFRRSSVGVPWGFREGSVGVSWGFRGGSVGVPPPLGHGLFYARVKIPRRETEKTRRHHAIS